MIKLLRKSSGQLKGRKRTTTPKQSGPAYSYYAQRSDQELNTGRQIDRPITKAKSSRLKSFWLQRFGLVILLLAAMVSLFNVLELSSSAKVIPLTTSSNPLFLQNQATYQAATDKLLAGSLWNRNKITINTDQISSDLTKQFPEITSVTITLPLLAHRPLVYLVPAQPSLTLSASNGTFILDQSGRALIKGTSSRLNLPSVTDQGGLQVKLGNQALTSSDVSFIQTVVAQLSIAHLPISNMSLPPSARELDVQLVGQAYFIKFNLESTDARQQAGTFLATRASLMSQSITPGKYIDVRIDGRAYYQ